MRHHLSTSSLVPTHTHYTLKLCQTFGTLIYHKVCSRKQWYWYNILLYFGKIFVIKINSSCQIKKKKKGHISHNLRSLDEWSIFWLGGRVIWTKNYCAVSTRWTIFCDSAFFITLFIIIWPYRCQYQADSFSRGLMDNKVFLNTS